MAYRLINAQPLLKDGVPPRHRRKKRDEDTTNNPPVQAKESINSRGAQFDLVEEAFPPLPGQYKILELNFLETVSNRKRAANNSFVFQA